MAPPFVLDYLAAHEIAQLQHMNHSPGREFEGGQKALRPRAPAARTAPMVTRRGGFEGLPKPVGQGRFTSKHGGHPGNFR
jgi:hypothetical protein